MNSNDANQQIVLLDDLYFGFDNNFVPQRISHYTNTIWLASSHFKLTHTSKNTFNKAYKTASTNHLYQSLAVRLLLNELITKIKVDSIYSCKTNNNWQNSNSWQNSDNIWLDETEYPYRLQPLKYYVSFTHSKNRIACAISMLQPLGIDMELNPIPLKLAHRFFHQAEIDWLVTLKSGTYQQATNVLWMLKEANMKKNSNLNHPITLLKALKNNLVTPAQILINNTSDKLINSYKPIGDIPIGDVHIYKESKSLQVTHKAENTYVYMPTINLVLAI